MAYVGGAIARAVAVARPPPVAVVFAADYTAETFDRPNLVLPGDQNDLISAVAAANPHTVVVLNTDGPVVMPWLRQVGAVLEDWYPGEEDGAAIAAVLTGDVDPSGHLPVTFPTSAGQVRGLDSRPSGPGSASPRPTREGLGSGYRYDHATGTKPALPVRLRTVLHDASRIQHAPVSHRRPAGPLSVRVTNTGPPAGHRRRPGLPDLPAGGPEPPGQLAAFSPVTLAAGAVRDRHPHRAGRPARHLPGGWLDHRARHLHDRRRRQLGVPAHPRRADRRALTARFRSERAGQNPVGSVSSSGSDGGASGWSGRRAVVSSSQTSAS